jgi:hypothetical protein
MVTRTSLAGWTRLHLGLAIAALGLGVATGQARASENLTFTLTPQADAGLISYAGGAAPLVGGNLGVSSVTGLTTGLHTGSSLSLDSGTLSFTTGNFSGDPISNEADFSSGGKLEIDGGIAALGIAPGTALMTGSFTGDTIVKSVGMRNLKIEGGAFFNVVNPTLAAYFGLPVGGTMYSGALATLFAAPTNSNGSFSDSGLSSGSVTTAPVPEPGTFLVFAALVGSGLVYRRRRAR